MIRQDKQDNKKMVIIVEKNTKSKKRRKYNKDEICSLFTCGLVYSYFTTQLKNGKSQRKMLNKYSEEELGKN